MFACGRMLGSLDAARRADQHSPIDKSGKPWIHLEVPGTQREWTTGAWPVPSFTLHPQIVPGTGRCTMFVSATEVAIRGGFSSSCAAPRNR